MLQKKVDEVTVDETGVDKHAVVDETGVDKLGINHCGDIRDTREIFTCMLSA